MQISIIGYVYWHYAVIMGIILLLSIPTLGWQSCACQRGYESTLDVNKIIMIIIVYLSTPFPGVVFLLCLLMAGTIWILYFTLCKRHGPANYWRGG